MRYIRLLMEYDGSAYHGWQSQRSGGTIQDIITGTLAGITSGPVKLTGASRTDAGVHALGQVAVFSTASALSADTIKRALNAKLPRDMRILSAEETGSSFHPRYAALRKSYFYLISTSPRQSAFLHRFLWDVRTGLDIGLMQEAAGCITGEHDFSSFRATGCGARSTIRTVTSLELAQLDEIGFMTASMKGDFIRIRIEANAFLRYMVRNIVGTLVEVGKGNISPAGFSEILNARDRTLAGPTAPPQGLFLEHITY
ncbi:MAG: tRNA pseudouridine(38-40) synthase TruA [Nitrospirae bacterium]|nr:MAG: tRNA pseudouridine(38-40) synthase TruA [Nitrospirota bacterium]